jgi:hypothetical protein
MPDRVSPFLTVYDAATLGGGAEGDPSNADADATGPDADATGPDADDPGADGVTDAAAEAYADAPRASPLHPGPYSPRAPCGRARRQRGR